MHDQTLRIVRDNLDTLNAVVEYLSQDMLEEAAEAWAEITDMEVLRILEKAPTKGGFFTVEEKKKMISPEFIGYYRKYNRIEL